MIRAFAAVSGVVLIGLWILLQSWRIGRSSALFVLSILPLALLFLIVPVPLAAVRTIQGFRALAAAGQGGVREAAGMAIEITRALMLGSIGFLVTLGIAAGLQVRATRLDARSEFRRHFDSVRRVSGTWVLLSSSLLVIPIGWLLYVMREVTTLIMRGSTAGTDVAQLSEMISNRLILAALGGFPMIAAVFVFGVGNLFAARLARMSDWLLSYSWAVFAVLSVASLWNVIDLSGRISLFEQAVH